MEIGHSSSSDFEDFEVLNSDPSKSDPKMDPLAPPAPLPDFVVLEKADQDMKEATDNTKNVEKSREGKRLPEEVAAPLPTTEAEQRQVVQVGGTTIIEEEEKNEPSMSSIFSWVRSAITVPTASQGKELFDKFSEKAKNTVDSVITTLDPQMKDLARSGCDIEIIVASQNEEEIGGVREAFHSVFGRAAIRGMKSQCLSVAPQPVGLISVIQTATEKEAYLRSSGLVHHQQPVISVQDFLLELTKDKWYLFAMVYLSDPSKNLTLHTLGQPFEVSIGLIKKCQESNNDGFKLGDTGYAMPIGHVAAQERGCAPSTWYEETGGISRRSLIVNAALALANSYKRSLASIEH